MASTYINNYIKQKLNTNKKLFQKEELLKTVPRKSYYVYKFIQEQTPE